MASNKPKLPPLKTPATATFPSELSALSAKSPLSAVPDFIKDEHMKTPITPPAAYMDFLQAYSPIVPEKRPGPPSSSEEEDEAAGDSTQESGPSTASSDRTTECSCKCEQHMSSSDVPRSPYPTLPLSAPPTGASHFSSLRVPSSPAMSSVGAPWSTTARSPLSATRSPLSATARYPLSATTRSPLSATVARSPFSPRCSPYIPEGRCAHGVDCKPRSGARYTQVITKTITYTPVMSPAPRGKRRKTTETEAVKLAASRAQAAAAGESPLPSPSPSPSPPLPAPIARAASA